MSKLDSKARYQQDLKNVHYYTLRVPLDDWAEIKAAAELQHQSIRKTIMEFINHGCEDVLNQRKEITNVAKAHHPPRLVKVV